MTNDLKTIEISDKIVSKVNSEHVSIFRGIRIYGSIDEPLFVAKDVESALGLSNLHIRDKNIYDEGFHYVRIMIPTKGGPQNTIVLTEVGLNKAMHSSNHPIAKQYTLFISVVMRELRNEGIITIKKAMELYKQKAEMLDEETDRQHEYIQELETREYATQSTILRLAAENEILTRQVLESELKTDQLDDLNYITLLEKFAFKPVQVYMVEAPSELEEFELNGEIPDHEVYKFKLSTKKLVKGVKVTEVMLANPTKQIPILGTDHECTLTELKTTIKNTNIQYMTVHA